MDNELTTFMAGQNSAYHNNGCCNDGMGWGGGWFIWIILIFAIFMGNGFGWGGNGNAGLQGALTRGEMADGFNTAEILRNQSNLMRDNFGLQRDVLENRYANQLAASMNAAVPPAFCAFATTCSASVVLPDDSCP